MSSISPISSDSINFFEKLPLICFTSPIFDNLTFIERVHVEQNRSLLKYSRSYATICWRNLKEALSKKTIESEDILEQRSARVIENFLRSSKHFGIVVGLS